MGQILFTPSGAGVTSDDVTATKAQVLSGYTALTSDSDDEAASGSMTNNGAWTSSSSGSGKITIPAGYHNGSGYVDCSGAYNKGVSDADSRVNTNSASYKSKYLRYIGSGGNGNYSATGISGWQGLTKDSFVFVPTKVHYEGSTYNNDDAVYIVLGNGVTGDVYPSISYNSGNGIVTVSGCYGQLYSKSANSHGVQANVTITGNVYCLV